MYLANDVIQNSKKKGPEFSRDFKDVLPSAFKNTAKYVNCCHMKVVSAPGIVLANRVSGRLLDTQFPKNHPSEHPNLLESNSLKCQFRLYI